MHFFLTIFGFATKEKILAVFESFFSSKVLRFWAVLEI